MGHTIGVHPPTARRAAHNEKLTLGPTQPAVAAHPRGHDAVARAVGTASADLAIRRRTCHQLRTGTAKFSFQSYDDGWPAFCVRRVR